MRQALGVRGEPVFRQVVRWPQAIPQYHVGHLERVARIEAAVGRHPGLFVAGNALHGVAMNDVAEQAGFVAERVAAFLANGRREPSWLERPTSRLTPAVRQKPVARFRPPWDNIRSTSHVRPTRPPCPPTARSSA